jgi:hypothetical protein
VECFPAFCLIPNSNFAVCPINTASSCYSVDVSANGCHLIIPSVTNFIPCVDRLYIQRGPSHEMSGRGRGAGGRTGNQGLICPSPIGRDTMGSMLSEAYKAVNSHSSEQNFTKNYYCHCYHYYYYYYTTTLLMSAEIHEKEGNGYRHDSTDDDTESLTAGEKKLVRRIDWHLLPWICILYALSLVDR